MHANNMKRSGHPLKAALLTALAGGSMALLGTSPARAAVLSFGNFPGNVFGGENCADVQGGSLNNSTPVNAYNCTAAPNQQFEFSGYTIYALGGQRCLDIDSTNETPAAGDLVDSYPCNGGVNQQWAYRNGHIIAVGSPTECAVLAATPGTTSDALCLDATPGPEAALCLDATTGANGTQLVINPCSDAPSQQWQIK